MPATNFCCLLHTSLLCILPCVLPGFGISFKRDLRWLIELHFPTSTQQMHGTTPPELPGASPSNSGQIFANFYALFLCFGCFFREQKLLRAAAEAAEAACARAGTPAPGSAAPWEPPGHGAVVPPNFPKSPSFCTFPNNQTHPQLW